MFTASWRVSVARTFGPGNGTGFGSAGASILAADGAVLSTEPLSILPVCWRGGTGKPSFGIVLGPPGPSAGPMLLLLELPLRTSRSCTEIGASFGDFGITNDAACHASKPTSP